MNTFSVVINACFGGFGLSSKAIQWLKDRQHPLAVERWHQVILGHGASSYLSNIQRDDPFLVECVRTLGEEAASGQCAQLEIQEVPVGSNWDVDVQDGLETLSHWPRGVASGR